MNECKIDSFAMMLITVIQSITICENENLSSARPLQIAAKNYRITNISREIILASLISIT